MPYGCMGYSLLLNLNLEWLDRGLYGSESVGFAFDRDGFGVGRDGLCLARYALLEER